MVKAWLSKITTSTASFLQIIHYAQTKQALFDSDLWCYFDFIAYPNIVYEYWILYGAMGLYIIFSLIVQIQLSQHHITFPMTMTWSHEHLSLPAGVSPLLLYLRPELLWSLGTHQWLPNSDTETFMEISSWSSCGPFSPWSVSAAWHGAFSIMVWLWLF